jgi:hypothetical protein
MCNWRGRIIVLRDKPLNLCDIECHSDHDPDHVRQKPHRMTESVRRTISSRATNATPSMMATGKNICKLNKAFQFIDIVYFLEFMNNAKVLCISSNTPANQVQPTSTRFAPNLEAIQNALKYDRKSCYPSIIEFEKVRNWIFISFYFVCI